MLEQREKNTLYGSLVFGIVNRFVGVKKVPAEISWGIRKIK